MSSGESAMSRLAGVAASLRVVSARVVDGPGWVVPAVAATAAAILLAGVAVAVPRTAGAGGDFVCSDRAQAAPVASARMREFVKLWVPRITDRAFMEQYLHTPGIPAEIRAEGFHDTSVTQRDHLVRCLLERLDQQPQPPGRLREQTSQPVGLRERTVRHIRAFIFDPDWLEVVCPFCHDDSDRLVEPNEATTFLRDAQEQWEQFIEQSPPDVDSLESPPEHLRAPELHQSPIAPPFETFPDRFQGMPSDGGV